MKETVLRYIFSNIIDLHVVLTPPTARNDSRLPVCDGKLYGKYVHVTYYEHFSVRVHCMYSTV